MDKLRKVVKHRKADKPRKAVKAEANKDSKRGALRVHSVEQRSAKHARRELLAILA